MTRVAPDLSRSLIEEEPATPRRTAHRLVSLDVFRGLTIAGMILVNNPGRGDAYAPLDHAPWNGWTPTDLIFPFFLFIVGVAIPFSMARRASQAGKRALLGHVWTRALSLFMLGALLAGFAFTGVSLTLGPRASGTPLFTLGPGLPEGFLLLKTVRTIAWAFIPIGILLLLTPYKSPRLRWMVPVGVTVIFYLLMGAVILSNHHAWSHGLAPDTHLGTGILRPDRYRIPGVLQRIAVCYGVAATAALFLRPRTLLLLLFFLLTAYSVVMLAHEPGTPPPSLTKADNRARRIDQAVFDRYRTLPDGGHEIVWKHTYAAYPDPEGLLSTLAAVGTVLLGILVGLGLRNEIPAAERCARLMAWGVVAALVGQGLDAWLMPINKSIWTPAFVFFCGGMAMLGLGTLFYVIDVRGHRAWAWPFVVYGMNAIAAFVAAGLLVRIGLIIKVARQGGPPQSVVTIVQEAASNWIGHFHALATPQNASLAYALLFVLAVWVPMAILYLLRIFVKV
jgi:predicted acyltransferase